VRHGDAHVLRRRGGQRHELVDVDPPALLEGEVEVADARLDGARREDVGRVVGADDDEVVTLLEQGRGDDEERLGGAGRDEDVGRLHCAGRPAARLRDQLHEPLVAHVLAVEQDHVAELDAELLEGAVADGALGEVVLDLVVTELLRRLDLDGHADVLHGRPPSDSPGQAYTGRLCAQATPRARV